VALNQTADVTVDALPGKIFKGHVTEVGDQALLRTTGVATSQSTTGTEEAKDFKVIVTLDGLSGADGSLPDDLRPGLSATAKITTAKRNNVVVIPIQALVQRDSAEEKSLFDNAGKPNAHVSATSTGATTNKPTLVQGVYILKDDRGKKRVLFVPVSTGVTGATDIEVISGVVAGDAIVTGRYKVLRTLKSGTAVKPDNTPEVVTTDSSSS
jgi:HlyD family secretion protein